MVCAPMQHITILRLLMKVIIVALVCPRVPGINNKPVEMRIKGLDMFQACNDSPVRVAAYHRLGSCKEHAQRRLHVRTPRRIGQFIEEARLRHLPRCAEERLHFIRYVCFFVKAPISPRQGLNRSHALAHRCPPAPSERETRRAPQGSGDLLGIKCVVERCVLNGVHPQLLRKRH